MADLEIPVFPQEDFIPYYPSVDDPEFELKIARKKEFNELQVGPEPGNKVDEVLYASQAFSKRMFSPYTEYTKAAFFHQAGAGKTCEASAIIEGIKTKKITENKRALIFVNNETLVAKFQEEIAKKCTKGVYNIQDGTAKAEKRRLRRKVSKYYEIVTHNHINHIMAMKPDDVKELYSGRTVILDEGHTITETTLSKTKKLKAEIMGGGMDDVTYSKFKEFLHLLDDSIVIIMTGSPIWDKPEGFAALMNLILPIEDELPTKNLSLVSPSELRRVLRGRVSFLRKAEDITKINMGITKPFTELVKVYPSVWSKFQEKIADEVREAVGDENLDDFEEDENFENSPTSKVTRKKSTGKTSRGGALGSAAIAASTMVYPKITIVKGEPVISKTEGIYKASDFTNLINSAGKGAKKVKYSKSDLSKGDPRRNMILKTVYSEIENNLIKYSAVFYDIVQDVINNPNTCIFIYCDAVKSSGGVFSLGLCLQIYGLIWNTASDKNSLQKSKKRRFTIITGTSTSGDSLESPDKIQQFLDVHNSPENVGAEISQVVIGSRVLRLGMTIKNTKKVHIVYPHWNVSSNNQAESRAIRLEALNFFPPEEREVQVYLHVAVRPGSTKIDRGDGSSIKVDLNQERGGKLPIDLRIMAIAEEKIKASAPIQRIVQEVSYDCVLMYRRNVLATDEDGSAECNYGKCNYQCDGIPPPDMAQKKGRVWDYSKVIGDLDYSTYNLLYGSERKDEFVKAIIASFGVKNQYSYDELKSLVGAKRHEEPLFILAVDILSNSRTVVVNRLGMKSYIKIAGDHIFLDTDITNTGIHGYSLVEYTNNVLATSKYSFSEQLHDLELQRDLSLIDQVCQTPTKRLLKKLSIPTRIALIEKVWLEGGKGELMKLIKNSYSPYFMNIGKGKVAHVLYHIFQPKVGEYSKNREKYDVNGLTRVSVGGGEFIQPKSRKAEEAILRKFDEKRIEIRQNMAINSKFELFGTWSNRDKVLQITVYNPVTERVGTGRTCSSYQVSELAKMLMKKIKMDEIIPWSKLPEINRKIFSEEEATQINDLYTLVDRRSEKDLKVLIPSEKKGVFDDIIKHGSLDQLKMVYFLLTVSINKNHAAPLCRYFKMILEDEDLMLYE